MKMISLIILTILILAKPVLSSLDYEPQLINEELDLFEEELSDEIPIIIELKEEPFIQAYPELKELPPYDTKIGEVLAKTFGLYDEERKIKQHKEKIEDEHKDTKKDLEDFDVVEIKREWRDLMNGMAFTIKREDFDKIKYLPNVKNVWVDEEIQVLLQDSVPQINADDVWKLKDSQDRNITGIGIKIAIIDTGIAYNHSDLGNCSTIDFTSGNCFKVEYGWDFHNNDNDPYDDQGHGTHCAGISAGNGVVVGVAPNATLLAYKVCNIAGQCTSANIISGIENATLYGADVISISLGGSGYADNVFTTVIDNAVNNNTAVVIAAGNGGPSYYSILSPGSSFSAITVGSSDKSNNIASYSSRGFTLYSNGTIAGIKPDLLAPGSKIYSTVPIGDCVHCTDTGYKSLSGTSMATPHIAGVVALLKQSYPNWTISELKSAISNTALDINEDPNTQGSGRVDVYRSYNISGVVINNNIFLGAFLNGSLHSINSSESLNLTNLLNKVINYSLSLSFNEIGVSASLNSTNLTLNNNESILFNIIMQVNNTASTNTYHGDIIVNTSENHSLSVPFSALVINNSLDCPSDDTFIYNNTILKSSLDCMIPDFNKNGVYIINKSDIIFNCNDSTIKGLDISFSEGIRIAEGVSNITITNCNLYDYFIGLYIYSNSDNDFIVNNSFISNKHTGVFVQESNFVTIKDNFFLNNTGNSIYYFVSSSYGVIDNNQIIGYDNTFYGIDLYSKSNYVNISNNIINGSGTCIDIRDSYNNIIYNNTLSDCSIACIFFRYGSSNNLALNNNISDTNWGIRSRDSKDNIGENNKFTSVTYPYFLIDSDIISLNQSDENVYFYDTNSLFYRNWYLTINVSNSTYPIQYADVFVYKNSSSSWELILSDTTDSNGLSSYNSVIQYIENLSKREYYILNITAVKGVISNSTIIDNFTTNSQVNFTLYGAPLGDITLPLITINSPMNKSIYTTNWTILNISINEDCVNAFYSLNGTSNQSLTKITSIDFYNNLTGLADNSTFNITFWANDTSGNLGSSDTIFFTINSSYIILDNVPLITIFTPVNNSYFNINHILLNFTILDDIDIDFTCWYDLDNNVTSIDNPSLFNWCYQESSNVSTACGGLSSGNYSCSGVWEISHPCGQAIDGDWATFGDSNYGDIAYLYVNYTKPITALNRSLLFIKDGNLGNSPKNLTIDSGCWNQNPLQFKITSYSETVNLSCWDGGNYLVFYNDTGASTFHEEAIWWFINVNYTFVNLTVLNESFHTVSLKCQDSKPQNSTSPIITFYNDYTNPIMYSSEPSDNDYVIGSLVETFEIIIDDNIALNLSSGSYFWKYPIGGSFVEENMSCSEFLCYFDLDMSSIPEDDTLDFYYEIKDNAGNLGYNGTAINPLTVTKGETPSQILIPPHIQLGAGNRLTIGAGNRITIK